MKLRPTSAASQGPKSIWHSRTSLASPDIVNRRIHDRKYGMIRKESRTKCDVCVETKQKKVPHTGQLMEESENTILRIDL